MALGSSDLLPDIAILIYAEPNFFNEWQNTIESQLAALNRVYLNIGTFSEEWLLHFNSLVGGKEIMPIKVIDARNNSAYYEAIENQTIAMALFFLKSIDPHLLKDATGGQAHLAKDQVS